MKPTQADRRVERSISTLLAVSLTVASFINFAELTSGTALASAQKRRGGGGGGSVYLSTPNPTNPLEHNNRGVELGSKGLWPQAIVEAQMALDGDPENEVFQRNLSAAHLKYGDSLVNRKSFQEAVKQYREALFVDPGNGPAENSLNSCLTHLGKQPGDVGYRLSLASGAESHGEYKIAAVEYRIASHIQDSGANSYKLGRALLKANKPVEGFEVLRTALRKDWPKDEQDQLVECHLLLADTLLNFAYIAKKQQRMPDYAKRLNNAMIEYRRACTINPGNMAAVHGLTETTREAVAISPSFGNLLALGSAYLLQADFDHAKVYFEKAWRANPSSPELAKARLAFHRAVVDAPQGIVAPMRIAESVQKIEDLLKAKPDDPDLLYILGKGRARIGDTAGAQQALEKSLSIRKFDPSTQHALDLLRGGGSSDVATAGGATAAVPGAPGAAATGQGANPGASGGTIASAAGAPGGAPPAAAAAAAAKNSAAYAQIDSLTKAGQLDQAAQAADSILGATPADGQAWLLKGQVMEKKGDLDEAAVCFRQAAGLKVKEGDDNLNRINNMRAKPLIEQADTAYAKGDFASAAALLKEASSMSPRDSALHRKLSEVLKKAGDDAGAERELRKADEAAKAK